MPISLRSMTSNLSRHGASSMSSCCDLGSPVLEPTLMLLRLGNTILNREKPLLPCSSKLSRSRAWQPASNAWRELSETVTLERVSCLRSGQWSAAWASGKMHSPKLATRRVEGEAERRCRQRHRLSDQALEAVVEDEVLVEEEDVELPEVVEGGGPEPAVEGHGDAGVVAAEAVVPVPVPDVEAAAGARVHGEGAGNVEGTACRRGSVRWRSMLRGAERHRWCQQEERT
jgi:hypothetical protein